MPRKLKTTEPQVFFTPSEYFKYRSCERKKKFGCEKTAVSIIRQMGDETLNAYQCRLCGWWHVGHSRKKA